MGPISGRLLGSAMAPAASTRKNIATISPRSRPSQTQKDLACTPWLGSRWVCMKPPQRSVRLILQATDFSYGAVKATPVTNVFWLGTALIQVGVGVLGPVSVRMTIAAF